jgi:hypothetical protein
VRQLVLSLDRIIHPWVVQQVSSIVSLSVCLAKIICEMIFALSIKINPEEIVPIKDIQSFIASLL